MGLDTSHDCWHGAYSAFASWREKLAEVAGIPLNEMEGYGGTKSWDDFPHDPLVKLLNHSDCDGSIDTADCAWLADRLEDMVPLLPEGDGGGHLWDWREVTMQFVRGLRVAASAGEDVEFH